MRSTDGQLYSSAAAAIHVSLPLTFFGTHSVRGETPRAVDRFASHDQSTAVYVVAAQTPTRLGRAITEVTADVRECPAITDGRQDQEQVDPPTGGVFRKISGFTSCYALWTMSGEVDARSVYI